MRILLTGGAGFIGHHFVEHVLKNTDWEIAVIDSLSYASKGFDRIKDINAYDEKRVQMFTCDFTIPIEQELERELGQFDFIIHMGAESHVDNSIADPRRTFNTNIIGTIEMLEFAKRQKNLNKFIFFSTDEVFGPAGEENFKEGSRHNPSNPYSASKAGAEDACVAYANTYQLPIVITNTMNVFGERQHPEKFIPKCVKYIMEGKTIPIHSNKEKTKSGSRFWIHARNVASALLFIMKETDEQLEINEESKGRFNIVGEKELNNLELAQMIAGILNKKLNYEMVDFHSSRPGHDMRYGMDGAKLENLGWRKESDIEKSMIRTIEWMVRPENKKWLDIA